VRVLAWLAAAIIVGLNLRLVFLTVGEWISGAETYRPLVWGVTVGFGAFLAVLLLWVTFEPVITQWIRRFGRAPVSVPDSAPAAISPPAYHKILVPLDHTDLDRLAIGHAAALARLHGAKLYLLHVEEDVTSQVYGRLASTAEVDAGEQYLLRIADGLRKEGIEVEAAVSHSSSPRNEIVRYAHEIGPDLVIMGAHGHGGLKDLIFGDTINPVRHELEMPILIVRPGRPPS
jgi:manganese transport protein